MARFGLAAGVASGVLLWLSTPWVGAGWVAWVALVPAAAAALAWPDARAGRLAVPLAYAVYLELSLVPALPFGIADGQWGDPPLPVLVGGSPVLPVALVAVPLFGALLYALGFGLPWRPARAPSRAAPALAMVGPAASWTALDLLRAKLDPGGLWGPLFLSQHGGPGAQLAAAIGPWLVTFAIVAASYALALALVRLRAPAPRAATAGAAGAALAAWALVAAPTGAQPGGRALTVAAVQPGYDTAEDDRPLLRHFEPGTYGLSALDLIGDLGELTRRAADRGARLVVWPEAVVWVDPYESAPVRRALARLAGETGAAIVVPYFLPEPARGATLVVTPDGRLSHPQPKQRPMWYLGERGAGAGPARPVAAAGERVGTMLGVDSQDPAVPHALAERGATVIASSTHDWRELSIQQRALARLHATTAEAPVVRADWRHGSAIYAADGRELADAGLVKRRTVLVAEVRAGAPAPYGDLWVAIAYSLAAAAVLAFAAGRTRALVARWTG